MANGEEENKSSWDEPNKDRQFVPSLGGVAQQSSPERMSVPLQNQQVYPGMGERMRVGQYQGKIIGSSPIFADTGMYLPVGAIEAQRAAADQAAAQKEQQLRQDRLNFELPEAPTIDEDPRFQFKLQEGFDQMLKENVQAAKQRYGPGRWTTALKSDSTKIGRRFKSDLAKYDTIAKVADNNISKLAEVLEDHRTSRKKVYSPQTVQVARNLENLMGRFEEADPEELMDVMGEFNARAGLDNLIRENELDDSLGSSVIQTVDEVSENKGYDQVRGLYQETVEKEADAMASSLTQEGGMLQDFDKRRVKEQLIAKAKKQSKQKLFRFRERDFNKAQGDVSSIEDVKLEKDKDIYVGRDLERGAEDFTFTADYAVHVGAKESRSFSGVDIAFIPDDSNLSDEQVSALREQGTRSSLTGKVKEYVRGGGKSYMRVEADVPVSGGDTESLEKIADLQKEIDELRAGATGGQGPSLRDIVREEQGIDDDEEALSEGDEQAYKKSIEARQNVIDRLKRDSKVVTRDVYIDMKDNYAYQMQGVENKTKAFIKSWLSNKTVEVDGENIDLGALPANERTEFNSTRLAQEWGGWHEVADAIDSGELKIVE